MSVNPEADFDLEKLFLPAWAQETPASNRFANYRGDEEARGERPGREGRGGPRRDFGGPPRDSQRGPRRDGPGDRGPRGPRPQGAGGPGGQGGPRPGGFSGPSGPRPEYGERRDFRPPPRPEPEPLPEINVRLSPEEKGAELLARQIKATGRAYALFDIARLVMQKPERYSLAFSVKKNAEGQIIQPLYLCALDDTLWLAENAAVDHILDKHFATFYQADRTQAEAPKGVYTFVAQCGISGVILGPPNHHDYQNKLRELHESRFARMPFDMFKSRVRIVRDEAVVKKWVDEQSWRTEYVCLNVAESPRLPDRIEVEKHFRATHLPTIVTQVEQRTLGGLAARNLRCPELRRLVNAVVEDQRHFPLQLSITLSQSFASRGLQFFKVNKTITHVCVARPQHLDLETSVVSDRVKRIVDYLNAHPKCKRRALIEALAPTPAPAPAADAAAPVEGAAPAPAAPATPDPTPEQTEISADLHWLIHQGHVVEFSDGHMELARKPLPKPELKPAAPRPAAPRPVSKPVEKVVAPAEAAPTVPAPAAPVPAPDAAPAPEPEASVPTPPTAEAAPPEPKSDPVAETPAQS